MPKRGYSILGLDPDISTKAAGREIRISPKSAREICTYIKGMNLERAKDFLEHVIRKEVPVPFRRHNKKVPHRKGLHTVASGRFPVKAAKQVLRILESAESNAMYKGLDTDQLKVMHASAYPGMKIKRYIPRAMGRATPRFETLCHIEIVLQQKGENT